MTVLVFGRSVSSIPSGSFDDSISAVVGGRDIAGAGSFGDAPSAAHSPRRRRRYRVSAAPRVGVRTPCGVGQTAGPRGAESVRAIPNRDPRVSVARRGRGRRGPA